MFQMLNILIIVHCAVLVVLGDKVRIVELPYAWTLQNSNGSIEITGIKLPSGVYSALSSKYGDLLQSDNDDNLRWISYENWTYTKKFLVNQEEFENVRMVNLTFNGIDTVSTIYLNEYIIGTTDNMFMRYSFEVLPYLRLENTIEIKLVSPLIIAKNRADALHANNIITPPNCPLVSNTGECYRNMIRKMQTSFGGKWNLVAPSMGIWQGVALEYFEVAIMRDIDIALQNNGSHWIMDIRAFLSTGIKQNFYGELNLFAPDLLDKQITVKLNDISYISPSIDFKVAISKERVLLWWPNGYGAQKLYPLLVYMNCWLDPDGPYVRAKSVSQKSLKIGFRTIELVEEKDDSGRTFFFKVNDVPIFIKGANYFPSHILPELSGNNERVRRILESAQSAHMNMIRVWGGGLYESDYFYSLADYFGLLVWQDMAFTAATYPFTDDFVDSVRKETSQNARRLAYHPSLAIIVTNDEIELYLTEGQTLFGTDIDRLEEEYKQLFMGTVMHELNLISRNGFSPRPGPMISTPSMGIEESKKNILPEPNSINYGDMHYWEQEKNGWDPDVYPWARFISKYGFLSLPIMASWNRTLGANDTIADLLKHRQHSPEAYESMLLLIKRNLPVPSGDWQNDLQTLIYFSQVSQAMAAKTATEVFRSQRANNRTMGALYWQLNDVWVAPSWSSIDFYGNYKLLYYWSREFLSPISVIALLDAKNRSLNVTISREEVTEYTDPRIYDVTMNTYIWSQFYAQRTITWQMILYSNKLRKRIIPLDTVFVLPFNETNCFLEFVLSESGNFISKTFYFPSKFSEAVGVKDAQLTMELSWHYCNEDSLAVTDVRVSSYSITVYARRPALFVYLEVYHPQIINYTLSENGFIQVVPVKTIHLQFEQFSECLNLALEDIRVLTMNSYILSSPDSSEELTKTTFAPGFETD